MPNAPKRPCCKTGCPALTRERYCDKHKAEAQRIYDQTQRPERHALYKTARWLRLRKLVLNESPLCVQCTAEGKAALATDVDHIIPFPDEDSPLAWDTNNLQCLCKQCHSRKTMKENNANRNRRD